MIMAAVHFSNQLGLFANGFAVGGQNQRADDRIQKSAQFDHASLYFRRQLAQSDRERVSGLCMSGTETFGKQQNPFFTHKDNPPLFLLTYYAEARPGTSARYVLTNKRKENRAFPFGRKIGTI